MRLAVCTLSAVLLSGCSWLGYGGGSSFGSSASCGAYGGQYAYGSQYGYAGGAGGCGAGYGAGAGGYGANGLGGGAGYGAGYGAGAGAYGANGYGVGTGALGLRGGVQGAGAYGVGGYGAGTGAYGVGTGGYGAGMNGGGTVLGGAAPYGAAAGGQFINGQWVSGVAGATQVAGGYGYGTSGGVTTVQGAPIYVPQPYPAYYGVAAGGGGGYSYGGGYAYGGGLRGGSAALPFGIEAGIGTEISIGGDIFPGSIAKPSGTNNISAIDPIAYKDAYDNAINYELAATFDVDSSTTLLGRIGYSEADGQRLKIGTIDDGALVSEDLYAQWGDMKQVSLEGGVRKYMGGWNNSMGGMRTYVQGTAGFTHNNAVNLVQDSATLAPAALNTQQYTDAGWTPTASGLVGAEMQVGPRTALGVEAGIRWRDDLNTNLASEDRWSVPVRLRGRVSF